ncbi:MAG: murein biosynthesis integral membrane protein MurJ, partial [Methanobacterium sp.]
SASVGVATLISRILGYVREMFMAYSLGTGIVANAFHIAFRLSNMFRAFFAEGALNTAFIPLFSDKLSRYGKEQAIKYSNNVFMVLFCFLTIFIFICEIFMPSVINIIAPGFKSDSEIFTLAVTFARISFPYLMFMSLSALFGGILNTNGRFLLVSLSPSLLNIFIVLALIIFNKTPEEAGLSVSYAVTLSGISQLGLIMYLCNKIGFKVKIFKPTLDPEIKVLLKKMVPGIIGAGIIQINLLISTAIASHYSGAVSLIYYADRIVQLPLALIGTSMGIALLPLLSKNEIKSNEAESLKIKNKAIESSLLLAVPACLGLLILSNPIIELIFQRGAFTAEDTKNTSYIMMILSFGLPAFILIKILTTFFFANHDTKTPFRIASICIIINLFLNSMLIPFFSYIGIPMSSIISSWINTVILFFIAVDRKLFILNIATKENIKKIGISSAIMCFVLLFCLLFKNKINLLFFVSISISLGLLSYFYSCYVLKLIDRELIENTTNKIKRKLIKS